MQTVTGAKLKQFEKIKIATNQFCYLLQSLTPTDVDLVRYLLSPTDVVCYLLSPTDCSTFMSTIIILSQSTIHATRIDIPRLSERFPGVTSRAQRFTCAKIVVRKLFLGAASVANIQQIGQKTLKGIPIDFPLVGPHN